MKKIILSAVSMAALTGSAFAADLPSHKAPIVAPQLPTWSGFYAGLNAGYSWGTNANTQASSWNANNWKTYYDNTNPAFYLAGANSVGSPVYNSPAAISQSGFLGGAQIGWNYQAKDSLLLGLEADFQGATISGNGTTNGTFYGAGQGIRQPGANAAFEYYTSQIGYTATNVSSGLNYLGTARGRVGYIITPSLAVYATGGLAYGDAWANASTTTASNTYGSFTNTGAPSNGSTGFASQFYFGQKTSSNSLLVGYSAGGGAEWMFMPNWSLKTEVLYYDLGSMSLNTTSIAGEETSAKVKYSNTNNNFFTTAGAGVMGTNVNVSYQGIVARAGVNYHFNFASAPVVAKF